MLSDKRPLLPDDKISSDSANDPHLRAPWIEKSKTAARVSDVSGSGYQELDVLVDPETRSLWCYMHPRRTPSITPSILYDFLDLHAEIAAGSFVAGAPGCNVPLEYCVQASRVSGIFNLGGDLEFMIECVRTGDRESLRTYAYNCVQVVFNMAMGFNRDIISIALVEGDALGGGFEGALGCNYIVAERRARFGFPEILFNCFPGMGAYSFLARRAGPVLAEKMMQNAKIYTAAEMYEMGIVNQLADDSRGKEVVLDYIKAGSPSYAQRKAICKIRRCVNPIELNELRKITDIWVDMALQLSSSDLKKMQRFAAAQVRRLQNESD
jgi:DSF synthase